MIKNKVRWIAISDVHLGNNRNTTTEIINNLDLFIKENISLFDDLDMFVIVGDLFDTLIDLNDADVVEIQLWVLRLLTLCSKKNIKVRTLLGTASHDMDQYGSIFDAIIKSSNLVLDYKYMNTLSIEYIEDLGLNILYVPDDLNPTAERTQEQVVTLLNNKNLKQVDIAFMHGNFTYQLPDFVKAPKHNEVFYLSIVKHYINIGHIHNFSFNDRIIAQGSFDRLTHGEEEPKGCVLCEITKNDRNFFFIENKHAKIFKTISLGKRDLEQSLNFIEKETKNIAKGSYIRIRATKTHPAIVALNEIMKQFPFFVFSKITLEEEEEKKLSKELIDEVEVLYTPIHIHKDNIVELLIDRIVKQDISSNKIENIKTSLLTFI